LFVPTRFGGLAALLPFALAVEVFPQRTNGRHDDTERREFLSIARVRKEVLGRSYIGAIATNR
jgi:hypothetical protein